MSTDPAIREFVGRIHEQSVARFEELHPDNVPRARPYEITGSLFLGIVSALLASATACVTLIGLMGRPVPILSEQYEMASVGLSHKVNPTSAINLPSLNCRIMACFAEGLGVVGIFLGGRRRVSLLSALGVLLALLSMVTVIGCELMLTLH